MSKFKRVVLTSGKLLFGKVEEADDEHVFVITSRGEKRKVKKKHIDHMI